MQKSLVNTPAIHRPLDRALGPTDSYLQPLELLLSFLTGQKEKGRGEGKGEREGKSKVRIRTVGKGRKKIKSNLSPFFL